MLTRGLGWIAAAVVVVAAAACTALLGDEFEITGATGATGGQTSAGGSGGTATGGGGSGGTGGSGDCVPATAQGCEPGEKCSVVDVDAGAVGCVAAGDLGPGMLCTSDTECDVGIFCDEITGVCEEICDGPGSTSICGLGWCVVTEVAGYGLCTLGCDPTAPNACSDPSLTCTWWGEGANNGSTFHCALPTEDGADNQEGDPCPLLDGLPILHSCAPGLICVGEPPTGTCLQWCTPPNTTAQCTGGKTCLPFPIPVLQHGVEYGGCL